MKQGTVKITCSCSHEFQDKEHGKNIRVANTTQKTPSPSTVEVRCTVCSKIHTVNQEKIR